MIRSVAEFAELCGVSDAAGARPSLPGIEGTFFDEWFRWFGAREVLIPSAFDFVTGRLVSQGFATWSVEAIEGFCDLYWDPPLVSTGIASKHVLPLLSISSPPIGVPVSELDKRVDEIPALIVTKQGLHVSAVPLGRILEHILFGNGNIPRDDIPDSALGGLRHD